MSVPLTVNAIADGNCPDPEELETGGSEEIDLPLPQKVRGDFDAAGGEPDDEEVIRHWKDQQKEAHHEEPDEDKEDLQQGDEGIDDPAGRQL